MPAEAPHTPDAGGVPADGSAAGWQRDTVDLRPGALPAAEPSSGERYRLGAELGRGGMGRVVEAYDIQLGRSVALKEALPRGGETSYRRFAREIQITARLEHASIVPLYDSGTTADGRPFYVMRRVTGRPFDELIARKRDLGERLTLLPALNAAIAAIGHAHRRGVIHRDLKPQNILVGELGETVVIDWGLAKVIGEADPSHDSQEPRDPDAGSSLHTQAGSVFGTPGFMAPEQARGEDVSPQGDVYALGATLYQLLSGVPPYRGKSATEVIDRNRNAAIQPIEEVAPAAPRELVAIVKQAMAAEAADRYANGAALAEDVRRFLDGQLVAAHRYTRGQRLRRFMRRHRAPLVVAAAAAVAVAALAWFSVHRVLRERALAVAGQRVAEERAEALIVARAHSLVDTNPTHALAALKALPAGSAHEAEARGVAAAAFARGVTWGIADDGQADAIEFPTLSPDGRRLAVVDRDGRVRVFDTDTHVLAIERPYPRDTRVAWISNGTRLFVFGPKTPALILDPGTATATALTLGQIHWAMSDEAGDRVIYEQPGGGASLFEVATGAITPLVTDPERVGMVQIAPDGSWLAVGTAKQLVIFDGSGTELARREGDVTFAIGSRGKQITVLGDSEIWQLDLPTRTWTRVPTNLEPHEVILGVVYRGAQLTMLTSRGEVSEWSGTTWHSRLKLAQVSSELTVVGPDLLAVWSGDGHVHWISATAVGDLALPTLVTTARLAGCHGAPRLVFAGDDLLLLYDLAQLAVARVDLPSEFPYGFLDDDTLVSWTNGAPWRFYRVKTAQTIEFPALYVGYAQLIDALPEEGRMLFDQIEAHESLFEVRDELQPFHQLVTVAPGPNPLTAAFVAALIPGGSVVYAEGNTLHARIGEAAPHDVGSMDSEVASVTRLGDGAFGAVSASGEVVRGLLATSALERGRVPKAAGMIASGYAGKLVIATGDQLMLWSGAGTEAGEIAHFKQPITRVLPIKGGLTAQLADRRVMAVVQDPLTGAWTSSEILPRGTDSYAVANAGELVIAAATGGELQVVELPARVRWTLPLSHHAEGTIAISPTSRQIAQQHAGVVMWTLPHITGDLHAWLERTTNATEDADGDLAWPWQAATPPPVTPPVTPAE